MGFCPLPTNQDKDCVHRTNGFAACCSKASEPFITFHSLLALHESSFIHSFILGTYTAPLQ